MIKQLTKAYDTVDEQLLKVFVKGAVTASALGIGSEALAGGAQQATGGQPNQKTLIKSTTGYDPDNTNITAQDANTNATSLGSTIMNIVMTIATVFGLILLFFGVMSLRKINQQGGGQDEKKKAFFQIITGVLLSVLGLLYAVFFALMETSLLDKQ